MLNRAEPCLAQFRLQRVWREEKLEWFSRSRNPRCQRFECHPPSRTQRFRSKSVIKADSAPVRLSRNGSQRRAKSCQRQVRNHTEPPKKRRNTGVKTRLVQPFGKSSMLEIQRNERQIVRRGNVCLGEKGSFPLLCGWKIHLEYSQAREGIAIGKCVEPGAQNHVLPRARCDRLGQLLLGMAAPRCHKCAKRARHGMCLAFPIQLEMRAQQRNRHRVRQHTRPIHHLVRSSADGNPQCSSTGAACFHIAQCKRRPAYHGCMNWIGWAILSAVFAAATALLAKVGVEHVDSNLATALRTTVVLFFAWGIAFALGKHGEIRTLDRRTLLFLALSGLATGLSWLCYFRALQLGPASRVAPLDKLSVPLVMVFAWLVLGEKLTAPALLGGALITTGAVVMVLG